VGYRWPYRMRNPVRGYDWGSTTVLARLQGREPTGAPEAELWIGAHSSDPSVLLAGDGGRYALDALIAADPERVLGASVHQRFGPRLPFLLKVLAIDRPLSLQVHPSAERARAVFAGEASALGGHRYVDGWPKPELLVAVEPVEALCGFRPVAEVAQLLALAGADPLLAALRSADPVAAQPMTALLRALLSWPADQRGELVTGLEKGATHALDHAGPDPAEAAALEWLRRLAKQFPGDPLVAAPLLLELVWLAPGEVLFVPAGTPHAYLHGVGVEIMANSDNVVRAGLTHKPVAVEELLHIVDGGARPFREVATSVEGGETTWLSPAAEFRLSRITLDDGAAQRLSIVDGPQALLCLAGGVAVSAAGGDSLTLDPGESAFLGADAADVNLTALAPATQVFRARV
jgi:mannose-6-phosphate isomerase